MEHTKKEILSYYKNKLGEMISSDDFDRFFINFDKSHIMKYSELNNYNSIDDLLPNKFDYKFILIELQRNSGHWTVLIRNNNNLYFFDSYGKKYDGEWSYVPNIIRKMLNQSSNKLTSLLNDAKRNGYNIEYNKEKYQSDAPNINTCGRYCVMAVKSIEKGYDIDGIEHLIDVGCEKNNCNADILICKWFP